MAWCCPAPSHCLNQCVILWCHMASSGANELRSSDFYVASPNLVIIVLVDSSPPSATYMHQWLWSALVEITACCLFSTKPLSKPIWVIVNWTLRNKLQWNFNQNTKLFIHEKASENIVYEMAAILSRERWVNCLYTYSLPSHSLTKSWFHTKSNFKWKIKSVCYDKQFWWLHTRQHYLHC